MVQELIWFKNVIKFLEESSKINTINYIIFQDNLSCINFIKNNNYSERTKHIDIKIKFILQELQKYNIDLQHVMSTNMIADIFTKPLSQKLFSKFTLLFNLKYFELDGGLKI